MSIRTAFVLSLLIVTLQSLPASLCYGQDELATKIRVLAEPYVASKTVVGLSVGVIKDGKMAEVHLGSTDGKANLPDGDTVYEIGSISKVFTGVLLADVVARGDAKLSQPAQELLPAGAKMPHGKSRAITLLDMSIHQSGLPRLPSNMPTSQINNPYADYTSELAHKFLNGHKLRRDPGEQQEYSNFAVSLLGHLLCNKAGKEYDALLTERITGPLGMNDTHVALSDSMKQRLAKPFTDGAAPSANWDFADMPGAGGIRSTTKDMLKFAQACIKSTDSPTSKAMDLAWKEHYPGGQGDARMGLGWNFAPDGSTRWHNGQTGGYHSMLMVNRELGVAVIVMTNTGSAEVDQLAGDVIRTLAGMDVQPRKFAKEVEVDAKKMQRLVGKYQLVPTFVFDVKIEDGKLMVGITNQPTQCVYPKSETTWFYKSANATLEFDVDENGKCDSLVVVQNGLRQKAQRIK